MQSRVEEILQDTIDGVPTQVEPQSRVESLLKELNNKGGGGGGINYSTEEQDTGLLWINGKKIYQKTYYITESISNMGEHKENLPDGFDRPIHIDHVINYENGKRWAFNPSEASAWLRVEFYDTTGDFKIINHTGNTVSGAIVTIQYIKKEKIYLYDNGVLSMGFTADNTNKYDRNVVSGTTQVLADSIVSSVEADYASFREFMFTTPIDVTNMSSLNILMDYTIPTQDITYGSNNRIALGVSSNSNIVITEHADSSSLNLGVFSSYTQAVTPKQAIDRATDKLVSIDVSALSGNVYLYAYFGMACALEPRRNYNIKIKEIYLY